MQSKSVTDEFKGKIESIKKRFEDEKKK
jgi:hypothetical protein